MVAVHKFGQMDEKMHQTHEQNPYLELGILDELPDSEFEDGFSVLELDVGRVMLVLSIIEVELEILEGKRKEPIKPVCLLAAFSNHNHWRAGELDLYHDLLH